MIVILCLPIAFLMIAQPTLAGAMVSQDPIGDTNQVAKGMRSPAYMDIVSEKLAKNGDVYVFSMKVAPVPNKPILSQGVKMMFWNWAIDCDPNVYWGGWPLPPGWPTWPEFHIPIVWDGEKFSAFVIDHRPLLTGGEDIFREVPFVIKGCELSLTVDAWMIDDVAEFSWGASTSIWIGGSDGTYGFFLIDYADVGWLPWPS
jgi:hypothetical protein